MMWFLALLACGSHRPPAAQALPVDCFADLESMARAKRHEAVGRLWGGMPSGTDAPVWLSQAWTALGHGRNGTSSLSCGRQVGSVEWFQHVVLLTDRLLDGEPDPDVRATTLWVRAEAVAALGRAVDAEEILAMLVAEHPHSPWAEAARKARDR